MAITKDRQRVESIVNSLRKNRVNPDEYAPVYNFLKKHNISKNTMTKTCLMPYIKIIDGKKQAPIKLLNQIKETLQTN